MSMFQYWTRITVATLFMGVVLAGTQALAYAPEEDLMNTKGYSPELIKTTQTQRSRQEWRSPAPPTLSPVQRFFHNIYYNEWTGNLDPFGSQVIRNHP